jgi:hypothetical protein
MVKFLLAYQLLVAHRDTQVQKRSYNYITCTAVTAIRLHQQTPATGRVILYYYYYYY